MVEVLDHFLSALAKPCVALALELDFALVPAEEAPQTLHSILSSNPSHHSHRLSLAMLHIVVVGFSAQVGPTWSITRKLALKESYTWLPHVTRTCHPRQPCSYADWILSVWPTEDDIVLTTRTVSAAAWKAFDPIALLSIQN